MVRSGDRLLLSVAGLDRVRLPLIALAALLATAAGLLLPEALAAAVDAAIGGRFSWPLTTWLIVLGTVGIAGDVVGGVLAITVTSNATAWLRRRVASHLLALGPRSGFQEGDAISRITGDSSRAGGIAAMAVQLASAVLVSIGAVVALALLDPWLAVVFVASVPLAVLLARSHLRLTADDTLRYQRVSGELAARLLDAVAGLRTITASGIADAETERVLRPLPGLGIAGRGMWRTQARMVWRAALLLPAVELVVLVAAGYGLMGGRLSVGDVLAALGYVALGMTMVTQIPLLTTLSMARSCAVRIVEVLDTPVASPGCEPVLVGPGRLELHGVGLDGVFSDLDLTVPPGSSVAVVGRSGSGKSVLVGLLGGLLTPDRGVALLDGVPLHLLRPEQLRAAVAYAFERPALLGESIGDAVGYGALESRECVVPSGGHYAVTRVCAGVDAGPVGAEAVRAACHAARVHDVLVRLPDGYRTPLADTPLSGGEAQRVGLARALVRRPRVLILDDATSSLDTVTEAEVEHAIDDACPGATRILVTHRAATAARAERVVWLDGGRVRAFAPHEVLWREPQYRREFLAGGS
jgi:ATP-binding cassette subfamily B protein